DVRGRRRGCGAQRGRLPEDHVGPHRAGANELRRVHDRERVLRDRSEAVLSVPLIPNAPAWSRAIRTVGVTGANGQAATATWIGPALRAVPRPVARATTVGYYLDDEELALPKDYDGFLALMHACKGRGGTHAAIELTSEALARGFMKAWPAEVGVFTN